MKKVTRMLRKRARANLQVLSAPKNGSPPVAFEEISTAAAQARVHEPKSYKRLRTAELQNSAAEPPRGKLPAKNSVLRNDSADEA